MTDSAQAPSPQSVPRDPGAKFRVLLVDDQAMIGEAVRRMLVREPNVEFLYCGDPAKALNAAAEFKPTVILQDLVMPEIDGLTMLRMFRENEATREIPMIVLSTKEDPKVKAEAFALGANDYLVKLPDPIELAARIRHHSRGYVAQIERNEAYAALKRSQQRLAEELAQAAKYVESLLPARMTGEIKTEWRFMPSVELGGDAFGYHWLDDDHFAVYLLDVCGHGVKAALLSISAMNVIRNQSLPSTDFRSPAQVLGNLNEVFQMDRHNNMYFTLWYGVYDKTRRTLTYSTGGHPSVILIAGSTAESARPIELSNPGMIVGVFPGMSFDEHVCELPSFCRLYVFSDGVYEVTRPDGTMMTFPDFLDILGSSGRHGGSVIDQTISSVRAARGSDEFEDDVSIVEVTF